MRHFLRLFWSSQNRKPVIFELAPGPGSALSAPALTQTLTLSVALSVCVSFFFELATPFFCRCQE